MSIPENINWRKQHVDQVKDEVLNELKAIEIANSCTARLNYCLKRIEDLGSTPGSLFALKRLIFIVSALIHHRHHGGLKTTEIRSLMDLGELILRSNGVRPGRSKLGFLYGDLHLAHSQILWADGRYWLSAWEVQTAHNLSRPSKIQSAGFEKFTLAIRTMRLGDVALSLRLMHEAKQSGLSDQDWSMLAARMVRLLRLAKHADLERFGRECLADHRLADWARNEIEFEQFKRIASESGDLLPMVLAVQRGSSHYQASSILEARLWALSTLSVQWMARVPTVDQLRRRTSIDLTGCEVLSRMVHVLDQCYDREIALPVRISQLSRILDDLNSLSGVDKELLVLAAALRVLIRSQAIEYVDLVRSRYRALSHAVSDGNLTDVLGILGDAVEYTLPIKQEAS